MPATDDDIVQREQRWLGIRRCAITKFAVDHHAAVRPELAVEIRSQCAGQIGGHELGEKAEPAHLNANHGYGAAQPAGSAEDSAIASESNGEPEAGRHRFIFDLG